MKRSSIFLLCFLILVCGHDIGAAAENDPVTVTGMAAANSPNARDQALKDAFRMAIEQAVGVNVTADSVIKNNTLLKDEIYAHSEGFIEKWDIVKEDTSHGNLTLTVKAWVREGRLNKTLFLNGLDVKKIYSWIGEPRVLIMMQEFTDNQVSEMGISQTELENEFIEKGIDVFNQMQIAEINARDKELAFKDAKAAVTLGKRFGAEIVVSGKCIANFSREIPIGQFKMNFYSTIMQIRAYSTATGKLIHSANYSSPKRGDTSAMGKFDAAVNSIKATLAASKSDILYRIVKNWYDDFSQPKTYQVMVRNLNYSDLEKLKQQFYTFEGFQKLLVRSFANNIAEIDIRYESLRGDFMKDIQKPEFPYRITQQEQNRIHLEHK
ncbi:MAG: hypothetical protein ACOZF0_08160 [Thermodesulfobacteriota bacterium]